MKRIRVSNGVLLFFLTMMFLMVAVGCGSSNNAPPPAAVTYTVTFDSQGATTAASPTSKTVTSPATTIDALPTAPTKGESYFGGWWTAVNGGGTEFTATTVVTADITVYAYWSANPVYIVTYNSEGGSAVGAQHVTAPATTVGTLPTSPTKTGSTFAGWWTAVNGSGTQFTATTAVTGNITVFANWTAGAYSQADITGTWKMHMLRTGNDNRWSLATVTFDSSGNLTAASSCLDSAGSTTCPAAGTLQWTIDANGVISETGTNGDSEPHYTMTSNKNFIAGTGGSIGGSTAKLKIMQKVVPGTTYSNADLQNKSFVFHELAVGADFFWVYGAGTTDATGLVTVASMTLPTGTSAPGVTTTTFSVDANGVVTMSDETSFNGFLSDDKKTIVGTLGTSADGDYSLMIFQIIGRQYIAGPLPAGTWVSHALGCGSAAPAPFWFHYTTTVASGGVMSYSNWVASNAAITPPTGTTTGNISSSGTVTVVENASYNGQMSDDGKFVVGTQTFGTTSYGLHVNTR